MHMGLFSFAYVCVKVEKLGIGSSNSKLISPIVVIPKCSKTLAMCWFCEVVNCFLLKLKPSE